MSPPSGRSGWVLAAMSFHAVRTWASLRSARTGSPSTSKGFTGRLPGRTRHPGSPVPAGWPAHRRVAGGRGDDDRGCPGRGQRQRGWFRAGDLDEGGAAVVDVTGLPGLQGADEAGVGGPGVLDAGGALIAPGGADELVRRFQHPAGAGERDDGFGVGGVQEPDAAVGGGGDPVPLVLIGAEALPGLGGDLDAEAERPAAFIQVARWGPGGRRRSSRRRRAGSPAVRCRGRWRCGRPVRSGPWPGLRRPIARGCLPGCSTRHPRRPGCRGRPGRDRGGRAGWRSGAGCRPGAGRAARMRIMAASCAPSP